MRDAATLSQLHRASFHRGWGEGEFETHACRRNTFTQRLMLGRTPIGFIISRLAADEAEILSVAVAQSASRTRLLARPAGESSGHLAGRGIRRVFLEVEENNQPAVRLYQRAGFTTVGPPGTVLSRRERRQIERPGHATRLVLTRKRCQNMNAI